MTEGEPLASVFARNADGIDRAMKALSEAITIGESGRLTPLITHRATVDGLTSF